MTHGNCNRIQEKAHYERGYGWRRDALFTSPSLVLSVAARGSLRLMGAATEYKRKPIMREGMDDGGMLSSLDPLLFSV